MSDTPPRRVPDRLFRGIVGGLLLGVAVGITVGDAVRPLEFVSSGFIKLLQVNVLPYLLGSLIASLGGRGPAELKLIARYGVILLAIVWSLALAFVVLSPLAFPPWSGGATLGMTPPLEPIDWLDLYIPSNLFHALSNNLIPAVVLFGILAGVALGQMRPERKEPLLRVLDAFNEAMARVSRMILRITPVGLFAIAAVTAGEMRVAQLLRLQLWLVVYLGAALLMTFWALPGLVSRLTPIPYREFLAAVRSPIVTAAAAGDALVVLPLITEVNKSLLKGRGVDAADAERAITVAVPLLYNFPHAAKVLTLAFLPFAAWYAGHTLDIQSLIVLASAGLLSMFSSVNTAIPFLLDLLRLPADLYELFQISSVINRGLGSMTSAMHVSALSVVVASALVGQMQLTWRRLLRFLAITVAIIAAFLAGTRALFTWVLPPAESGLETLAPFVLRPPLVAVAAGEEAAVPPTAVRGDRLEAIRARGVLRVGYFPDALPWAFVNADGVLSGYDIEAAHRLASDLGLTLRFASISRPAVPESLDSGRIDIVMSGYAASARRAERVELTQPYSREHVGFLVKDYLRGRFTTIEALRRGAGLVVAVSPGPDAQMLVTRLLPAATIRTFDAIDDAIGREDVDALLISVERAAYWSRVRSEYSAVQPADFDVSVNAVYAVPLGERELCHVVDVWIDARRAAGDLDEAYAYWVRGHAVVSEPPRWSLMRDVLRWR